MARIALGWALWGKRAGDRNDYSILSCSAEPFRAPEYAKILTRFAPGTPPSRRSGPGSLPWVTVSWAGTPEHAHLGLAIQDWSGEVDGVGRSIALTSYFCVTYRRLPVAISYRALYEAVRDVVLPREGQYGGLLEREVAGYDPEAIAADIDERFGEEAVWGAAARLLTRPVTIVQAEQTQLLDRLRFLDAVAALLPYGYRTRFTGATWSNSGSRHRIRLAFARQPREGGEAGYTVVWGAPSGEPPADPVAREYFEHLRDLAWGRRRTVDIVAALAAEREPCRFEEPRHALHALERINVPLALVRSVREGRKADGARLREVFRSGQARDLPAEDRRLLLAELIGLGDPQDWALIREWWDRAAGDDPEKLVAALIEAGRAALWRPEPHPVVHEYLGHALARGFGDRVLAGLVTQPRDGDPADLEGGLGTAAELLVQELSRDPGGAHPETRAALLVSPRLVCAVLAQVAQGGREAVHGWLRWLDGDLPGLLDPFTLLVREERTRVRQDQLAVLAQHGRDCVWALVQVAEEWERLGQVLPGFAEWLAWSGAGTEERRGYWARRLAEVRPAREDECAVVDVLLLLLGSAPAFALETIDRDWEAYRRRFVEAWRRLVTKETASRAIARLADHLRTGRWSVDVRRSRAAADLAGELMRDTGLDWMPLARALYAELTTPIPAADPALQHWLAELVRVFPDVTKEAARTAVAGETARAAAPSPAGAGAGAPAVGTAEVTVAYPRRDGAASPESVRRELDRMVAECVAGFHDGRGRTETVQGLRPSVSVTSAQAKDAEAALDRLRSELRRAGADQRTADEWAIALAVRFVRGDFGGGLATDLRQHLRDSLRPELVFQARLLDLAARGGRDGYSDMTAAEAADLEEIVKILGDLHKDGRKGERWRKAKSIVSLSGWGRSPQS